MTQLKRLLRKGIMDKVTYELIGYESEDDFDSRQGFSIINGLTKAKAFNMLSDHDLWIKYNIIKIQSSDREFIMILKGL